MQFLAKEVTQCYKMNKMTVKIIIVQRKKFTGPLLSVETADKVVDYKEECKFLRVLIDR